MTSLRSLATLATLAAVTAVPAWASGSASSASSEGLSASVGGTSTSLETSSQSSTGGDRKVAAGAYRVVAVADAGRDGLVRLQLAPTTDGATAFALLLPRATADASGLAAGDTVLATHRDYGIEFARGDTRQAFFLVVDDAWQRDLQTRAVQG
jgi:hypothetical protein